MNENMNTSKNLLNSFIVKCLMALIILYQISIGNDIKEQFIMTYSVMSKDTLVNKLKGSDETKKGVILFFIASKDNSPSPYTIKAFNELTKEFKKNPSAINQMLLGAVYSVMARDEKNEMKSSKYVEDALNQLKKAVDKEPKNSLIREFRMRCLVNIPDIFDIQTGLKDDIAFFESEIGTDSTVSNISKMMAVASVYYKLGELDKCSRLWKKVVALTGPSGHPVKKQAEEMLDKITE